MEKYHFLNTQSEEEAFSTSSKIEALYKNNLIDIKELFVIAKDVSGKFSLRHSDRTIFKYNESCTVAKSVFNILGWPFSQFYCSDLYMTKEKKVKVFISKLFSKLDRPGFVVVVILKSSKKKF